MRRKQHRFLIHEHYYICQQSGKFISQLLCNYHLRPPGQDYALLVFVEPLVGYFLTYTLVVHTCQQQETFLDPMESVARRSCLIWNVGESSLVLHLDVNFSRFDKLMLSFFFRLRRAEVGRRIQLPRRGATDTRRLISTGDSPH